jgi:hypothetical protein
VTSKARQLGNSQEARIVKRATAAGVPARRQPRSGELAEYPADAVVGGLLVEGKVRAHTLNARGEKVLSINLDWYNKVREQASKAGFREGVLVVAMKGSKHMQVVVDFDFFLSLLDSQKCE